MDVLAEDAPGLDPVAVFHDLGNLNVTVVVPGYRTGLAADLARLISEVTRGFGLEPWTGERGVHVAAAKVSGLAGQVTRSGTLAHASLMVTTPAVRVEAYLAPAPVDLHTLDSRRGPVAPLCAYLTGLDVPAVRAAVLVAARRRSRLRPRCTSGSPMVWRSSTARWNAGARSTSPRRRCATSPAWSTC